MPYCENCGNKYNHPRNFCRRCGSRISAQSLVEAESYGLSGEIAIGIEQGHQRVRRRETLAEGINESTDLYIRFLAVVALLQGFSYMADGKINLLNGQLGTLLYGGIALAVIFKVIFDLRYGYSLFKSLIEVILFGALISGGVHGIFWFITENYLHAGKPLLVLPNFPVPTPTSFPAV